MPSTKRLTPAFQPIVDAHTQRHTAAEVLARWEHNGDLLTPAQNNDIDWIKVDIDTIELIRQHSELCRIFFPTVFINVSLEVLESDLAMRRWVQAAKSVVEARRVSVVIEITESIQPALLNRRWKDLKGLNVALALDDFGDKHSDFSRLTSHSWDFCKFSAKRLAQDDSLQAALYCMDKGVSCIVEQVETICQRDANLNLGVRLQQGYLHQKPQTLSEYISEKRVEKNGCSLKKTNKNNSR